MCYNEFKENNTGSGSIKRKRFDELIKYMSNCTKCTCLNSKTKDCSLINIYKDIDFSKTIPSIWTDWYNRLDSEIMIIGQDWGPYEDMKKLNTEYLKEETLTNWSRLIESEKSLTKKQLTRFITESSNGKVTTLDNFYITNAIMCARKGTSYRSDNINLKKSTCLCIPFLEEQISIVEPKIILTLGYYPLLALSLIFNFKIAKNLKETIKENPIIKVDNYLIIPLYHPVAQIRKEEQLLQYKKIWQYLKKGEENE